MPALILGLVLFLGVHMLRVASEERRSAWIERLGEGPYKGLYSLAVTAGLVLITWGYAATRAAPVDLWWPPMWTRHLSSLLVLVAFVLVVAAYTPGSRIKAVVGHPMVLGTGVWSAAHLLANGRLADVLLFGGFLAWAIVLYAALLGRDRRSGKVGSTGAWSRDAIAIAVGAAMWAATAFWLHAAVIGVAPFV